MTRISLVTDLFFLQALLFLSHSQSLGKHNGIALPPAALKSCLLVAITVREISNVRRSSVSLSGMTSCFVLGRLGFLKDYAFNYRVCDIQTYIFFTGGRPNTIVDLPSNCTVLKKSTACTIFSRSVLAFALAGHCSFPVRSLNFIAVSCRSSTLRSVSFSTSRRSSLYVWTKDCDTFVAIRNKYFLPSYLATYT